MITLEFIDNGFSMDARRRRFAAAPLVVSGAADMVNPALRLDGALFSMLKDELKPQLFSFTRKAVAFFRMSRSMRI